MVFLSHVKIHAFAIIISLLRTYSYSLPRTLSSLSLVPPLSLPLLLQVVTVTGNSHPTAWPGEQVIRWPLPTKCRTKKEPIPYVSRSGCRIFTSNCSRFPYKSQQKTALSLRLLRGGNINSIDTSSNNSNSSDASRPTNNSTNSSSFIRYKHKMKKKREQERDNTKIEVYNDTNTTTIASSEQTRRRGQMYLTCILIVLLWISTGTIFYSKFNDWPLAQSFFYAVDAGMSIGFCTDVVETRIGSRAFTIVFILLGASSVGGALALFIQDIMEGAVELRNCRFEQLLAKDAFYRADKDGDGKLNYNEFRHLVEQWTGCALTDSHYDKLCEKFNIDQDTKKISSLEFLKKIPDLDKLLQVHGPLYSDKWYVRRGTELKEIISKPFIGHNRIFAACLAWVAMGITWGKVRMKWDIITATHFAISALATGGLTGPPVNAEGILPREPAIFCGVFCLVGIPLFALTLAHFARVLVESHVVAEEKRAIFRPLHRKEFDYAKSLCSPEDQMVHLSDFIVLQLLRMGKVHMGTIELIKTQFAILDIEGTGRLPQTTNIDEIK